MYTVGGERVARLFGGTLDSASPWLSWDEVDSRGRPAPVGVYLVRAQVGSETATTRVCRLR